MQQIIQRVLTEHTRIRSDESLLHKHKEIIATAEAIAQALREAGYTQLEDTELLNWLSDKGCVFWRESQQGSHGGFLLAHVKKAGNTKDYADKNLRNAIKKAREAGFEKGEG